MSAGAAAPARQHGLPAEDPGWWFAAIWLVFLVLPIGGVLRFPAEPVWRILAVAALAVFAVAYALAFRNPHLLPLRREPANIAAWFCVLLALALATVPVLGPWSLSLMPYLVALLGFRLALRPALVALGLVQGLVVAAILAGLLPGHGQWVLIMSFTSTVITGGMRIAVHQEEQRIALSSDLALVRERQQVARDVHDILGHSLTVITLKAELAQRLLEREPGRARTELDDVLRLSREALAEVRSTVSGLRTPDFTGQVEAARTALAAAGIEADVTGRPDDVPPEHRSLFAWVLREAVTNVVRHSRASRCTVRWTPTTLTVADDGNGVPAPEGNGLRGLRERAARAGGTVAVGLGTGGTGTVVEVVLP